MINKKTFVVVIGDLIRSRNIKNRFLVSKKIHDIIKIINREYMSNIFAPLELTKGIDEFSLVLKNPAQSYCICRAIDEYIYPERYRFAIVKGQLDIGMTSKNAKTLDGPAFHKAADCLNKIKKTDQRFIFDLGNDCDLLISEAANLIAIIADSRSARQQEIVELYNRYNNQKKIARKLKISQQAISDTLKQANYRSVLKAINSIDAYLAGR